MPFSKAVLNSSIETPISSATSFAGRPLKSPVRDGLSANSSSCTESYRTCSRHAYLKTCGQSQSRPGQTAVALWSRWPERLAWRARGGRGRACCRAVIVAVSRLFLRSSVSSRTPFQPRSRYRSPSCCRRFATSVSLLRRILGVRDCAPELTWCSCPDQPLESECGLSSYQDSSAPSDRCEHGREGMLTSIAGQEDPVRLGELVDDSLTCAWTASDDARRNYQRALI